MRTEFLSRASMGNLRRRAELSRQLRQFFDARGFLEVTTPILSRWCIIDRHLDPIRVAGHAVGTGDPGREWYLQTSPEQSMKRLLASGSGSIYQLGQVFRAGEFGERHNPEFTMAEWYDVGADLDQGLALLDALCIELLGASPAERVMFADAFRSCTGLELFDTNAATLGGWCTDRRLVDRPKWSDDWDDWVNLIFSEVVQPQLGLERPVLVTHFPASQAALARLSPVDPRTSERYELFYRGVELANGYHELLHDGLLTERATIANRQRVDDGKFLLPLDNPLLDAMRAGLPASCGCALGFDRLVMIACGATRLDEVIPFAADRA